MANQILGIPKDDYEYEFMVVVRREDYNYDFIANFEDGFEAEQLASKIGGGVVHNVRIAHKQLKQIYEKG